MLFKVVEQLSFIVFSACVAYMRAPELIEAQPEPNCSCDQRDRSNSSCIELALFARAIEPLPARTALALAFIEHNRMKPLTLSVHFDAQELSSSRG